MSQYHARITPPLESNLPGPIKLCTLRLYRFTTRPSLWWENRDCNLPQVTSSLKGGAARLVQPAASSLLRRNAEFGSRFLILNSSTPPQSLCLSSASCARTASSRGSSWQQSAITGKASSSKGVCGNATRRQTSLTKNKSNTLMTCTYLRDYDSGVPPRCGGSILGTST